MAQILKTDSTTLIYSLAQGKPDTQFPLIRDQVDNRPRVAQSPQKGPSCYYYAMNMLRERIGANSPDYAAERTIEKKCSDFRKECSTSFNAESDYDTVQQLVEKICEGTKLAQVKEKLHIILHCINNIGKVDSKLEEEFFRVTPIFEEFCGQDRIVDILEFAKSKLLSTEIRTHMVFLNDMGIDPKALYQEDIKKEVCQRFAQELKDKSPEFIDGFIEYSLANQFPSWETHSAQYPGIYNLFVIKAMADAYGFQVASWSPLEPISALRECLKTNGPLFVGGAFGRNKYSVDATIMQEVGGRSIFGWKSTDRKPEGKKPILGTKSFTEHAIVIIGAASGGSKGGFVYYVDPKDGSDPLKPEQQKVYVISYQNLASSIADLRGQSIKLNSTATPKSSICGYAYCFPKKNS